MHSLILGSDFLNVPQALASFYLSGTQTRAKVLIKTQFAGPTPGGSDSVGPRKMCFLTSAPEMLMLLGDDCLWSSTALPESFLPQA